MFNGLIYIKERAKVGLFYHILFSNNLNRVFNENLLTDLVCVLVTSEEEKRGICVAYFSGRLRNFTNFSEDVSLSVLPSYGRRQANDIFFGSDISRHKD